VSNQHQTGSEALVERLDHLTQMLELALAPQLDAARASIREDPINAVILDAAAGDWRSASKLQQQVEKHSGKKKRTVQDRIANLTHRGFLEKQGGGTTTEYRTNQVVVA
jgi:predicted HTH transcriptional regulator